MTAVAKNIAAMVDVLPAEDQAFAYEFVKKLILAWDPDFTKVTPQEAERIKAAEEGEFIAEQDIDWDNLDQYA